MANSLFLPSASITSLQKQGSPINPNCGASLAEVTPLEVLNSTAAKEIYPRLNQNDIRFIILKAGEPTDPVQCTLTTGHLDALPAYEALSYVWGSQKNPNTIQLNGQAFLITQNLHRALKRFRKPAEDRLIWIDALAINQSDILERNTQVRKMLVIYRSARAVLAWIGQGDEDLGGPTESWRTAFSKSGRKVPDWGCIFDKVQNPDHWQLLWSFKWLNRYEFWSRAWIMQEITQSKAVFVLGPYEATYEHFRRVWFRLMVQQYQFYNVAAGETVEDCIKFVGSRICAIMLYSTPKAEPKMLQLDSWLKSFILMHEPRCLDLRDMIYAFYGLFTPEIQGKISINYTISIANLFASMTKLYVEETGNLWLLSQIEISSRYGTATPTVDLGLPTWAFNFAGEISTLSRWHKVLCDKGVEAGKKRIFYYRFEMCDRPLLHVKGVCIGQVQRIDRTPRHKFFLGTSLELSKWGLGVTSDEEGALRSAFLGPFAEPEEFSNMLVYNRDSLNALDRKYWSKSSAAVNTHFERLMFSYTPVYGHGRLDKREFHRQFALGYPGVLTGDRVCLILGCPLPLLLRQAGNSYEVIGSAYAQDYMEGEAMDALSIEIDDLEDFCLC